MGTGAGVRDRAWKVPGRARSQAPPGHTTRSPGGTAPHCKWRRGRGRHHALRHGRGRCGATHVGHSTPWGLANQVPEGGRDAGGAAVHGDARRRGRVVGRKPGVRACTHARTHTATNHHHHHHHHHTVVTTGVEHRWTHTTTTLHDHYTTLHYTTTTLPLHYTTRTTGLP
jgi:hypothetical protein